MRKKLLFFILATLLVHSNSYGQCLPRLLNDSVELYFDKEVHKMTVDGHYLYAGGAFNYAGRLTGSFAEINRHTGYYSRSSNWPRAYAKPGAIPDANGGFIIYGDFIKTNGVTQVSLFRIDASGNKTSLNATANGMINAAVLYNGVIYIAGNFTSVNGVSRNRLAAISYTTGGVTGWDPNATNTGSLPCKIDCMLEYNGLIYVGGTFSHLGATARRNIAAINPTTGLVTGWAPEAYFSTAPTYGIVTKMHRVNNLLYICGQFDYTGGKLHPDVAAIDLSTAVSTNWDAQTNSPVRAIANKGDTLYIGGHFFMAGGQPRQGFAAFSISTGKLLPVSINTGQKISEYISDITSIGDTLYVGGWFDTINNQFRRNIAGFNRLTGAILPWKCYVNGEVLTVQNHYGRLFVGGRFSCAGARERNYIARIDMDSDTVDNWNPAVNGVVRNIVAQNKTVYISGNFTKVGDSARTFNAALHMSDGKVLRWDPKINNVVNDMVFYKGQIYVGGYFSNINGQSRSGIARLDTAGNLDPWNISITGGGVNDLEIYKDSLYVAGAFNVMDGKTRQYLGAVNLALGTVNNWVPTIPPGIITGVTKISRAGDTIFVVFREITRIDTGALAPTYSANTLYSFKLSTASIIYWDKKVAFFGLVKEMVPDKDRAKGIYIGGMIDSIMIGGRSDIVRQKHMCLLIPPAMPPSPPPTGYIPPPPHPTLSSFNPNLQDTGMNTMCQYGNKLYCGGKLKFIDSAYHNGVVFHLPYLVVDANLATDTNGVCSGNKSTLRVNSTTTYGADYQWNVNALNVANPLPYYTYIPKDKDKIYCVVSTPANDCIIAQQSTTNTIVYNVTPTVTPDISIVSVLEEENGNKVTVKAIVKNAATGYTIEWFNKGVSISTTTVDSMSYIKGPGTDSIYAIITPRTDTCYVTDTSALITINEKPVGITSLNGESNIQVYPNPFDGYVRIKGLGEGYVLTIYDVTGRKIIAASSANGPAYILPTASLKPGTYVLKIIKVDGRPIQNILLQKL